MIVIDLNRVIIENLDRILVIEPERIRCLLKHAVVELKGNQFHVHSLSEDELIVHGTCRSVELNER